MKNSITHRYPIYIIVFFFHAFQTYAQNIPAIWQNISTDKLEGTRTTCMGEGKDGAMFIGSINGVYRSVDKGQNWQRVNKGLPPQKPILAMCNTKDGVLFVAADSNVYRSYDNGDTWTKIMTATGERNVGFLYAHKSGDVYAGTWGGLYRSADSGASWQSYGSSIPHGVDESPGSYGCIAFGKYNRIFASSGYGIYTSTTNGASWTKWKSDSYYHVMASDTTDLVITNGVWLYKTTATGISDNGYLGSGEIAPLYNTITSAQNIPGYVGNINTVGRTFPRSSLIVNNKNVLCASRNYGVDSVVVSSVLEYFNYKIIGLNNRIVTELFKHSDGSIYAGTLGGGVYRTTDMGNTWKGSSKGLGDPYITYMFNDSKTKRVFAATGSGVFYTSDAGQSWMPFSEGLENYNVFKIARSSKGNYYALTWTGAYIYRADSMKWKPLRLGGIYDNTNFNDLTIGKNDTLIIGTANYGAFLSTDEGKSWKKIDIEITNVSTIYYSSSRMRWYAGASGIYYVSTNGCISWEKNKFDNSSAGGSGTVYYTEDADAKLYCMSTMGFTYIDEKTSPPTYTALTGNSPPTIYYLATNDLAQIFNVNNKGIYRMWQGLGNWSPYGDSLPAVATTALTIDNEGYAYVGTMGKGVFRTKLVSDSLFAPALLSPKNKAENVLYTNVSCMWDTSISARSYHLQLSTTEDMSQLVLNDSSLKGLQRSVNNLRSNTPYYWRVRAKHKQYLSEWSPVWTFKTLAQLPKKLQLLSPPDKSTAQPVKTTLTWTGDDNAESYEVQVMDAVSQTVVYADSTLTVTTASLSLEAKKSYQWKVRAKGSVGIGEWSDSWQFSTEESVGITEQAAEQQIRILPQPASETLHIMGIGEGDVQVVIADMQGRLLLSTEATHINISGLTDGVYTCRISAGGKVHCLCFSVVR